MQKHLLYINTLAISSVLAFTACTEEVNNAPDPQTPDAAKTAIELKIGGVDGAAATRAVITDVVSGKTFNPVSPGTNIYMVMKSKYVQLADPNDYGGVTEDKYCVTRGQVVESTDTETNDVVFSDTRIRYWDDAHARCSNLSIWAIMCPGINYLGGTGTNLTDDNVKFTSTVGLKNWQTTSINADAIEWNVPHYNSGNYQTEETIKNRDLCFSNNIADYASSTQGDRRLKFNTGTRKFQGGKLVFYHALSKITVNINKGEGFTGTTDFRFTETATNKNATLQYFNIWGKFNVEKGEWTQVNNDPHQAITGMYNVTGTTPNITDDTKPTYQLEALVIPYLSSDSKTTKGSLINNDATTKAIVFTIDNNKYEVSRADLLKALQDKAGNGVANDATSVELEAGKNYIFTFTVGKQKINKITAQVAEWKDVAADNITPSNAYVNVSVKTSERDKITGATPGFSLYRAAGATYTGPFTAARYDAYADYTWEKGYETVPATLTETSTDGVYSTNWYWPDNNTFYHFRTLTPTGQTLEGNDANTYVAIHGGVIKEGSVTAVDYLWGAPFKTSAPTPDVYSFTSGYCNNETKANGQLYKAIGATEDNITLIQHHMTSQVFVKLETTTGTDQVDLTDATVELTNVATQATLLLGNGLITSYSDFGTINMTYDHHDAVADPATPAYDYSYGVLPQLLTNNTSKTVGITITANDGNKYIIDNIQIAKFTGTDNPITKWEPGKKYYYTFRLIKTGIDKITATIVKWETVTADPDDVYIK